MMKAKDVLNLGKNFSRFEVIYGSQFLDNIINNIRLMDIPYENERLCSGDFVITSLDIIISERVNLSNVINILKEGNIGLFGFVYSNNINDEIMTRFQKIISLSEINFPVITIPSDISYRDIASNFYYIMDVDKFLACELKNNLIGLYNTKYFTTANIIKMMSHYIKGLIVVLSPSGEILDFVDSSPQTEEKSIPIDTVLSLINDNQSDYLSTVNPIVYDDRKRTCTIYPLKTNNKEFGYLLTIEHNSMKYTEIYNSRISNEAIPYIIISLTSYHENEVMNNMSRDEFIKGLIFGLYSDSNTALREAKFFNIEYNSKRFIWILNIKPFKASNSNPSSSDKIPNSIINEILNIARASFYDDFAVTDNPNIIFIRIKNDTPNEKLIKKYKDLLNTLEFTMPEYKFSIGISRAYETLDLLNLAYEDAMFSLRIGPKIFNNSKAIYAYDDLIVYHLIYRDPDNPILKRLYNNGIGKIFNYDKENKSQLFETIKVLVDDNFNLSEAADKLFIHRNTLYQRIKKIEEIIGLDINSSETRLLLHLGLKIHQIFHLM